LCFGFSSTDRAIALLSERFHPTGKMNALDDLKHNLTEEKIKDEKVRLDLLKH
jgi:hypothetical protein